jgi:hypothetical protein
VTELTLDDVERHALARELDRVRVAQLMRGRSVVVRPLAPRVGASPPPRPERA